MKRGLIFFHIMAISEIEIKGYFQLLVQRKLSDSYNNQAINSIKFYYEVVNDAHAF
jgi:hypothetical protein